MQLIYGTGNPAKINHMKYLLSPFDIGIVGIKELGIDLPDIDESGNNPLENACKKALAYYSTIRRPLFSCDSGLYFEGLNDNEQPGVHVRHVNGKVLNDAEMTDYYSYLAQQHGGKLTAQYRNAICLVVSDTEIYTHCEPDIWGEKFLIVDKPHSKQKIEGFPLDRLSVKLDNGKYYYDDDTADSIFQQSGWVRFFHEALKGRCSINRNYTT